MAGWTGVWPYDMDEFKEEAVILFENTTLVAELLNFSKGLYSRPNEFTFTF